jgi:ankyrin repeat protein
MNENNYKNLLLEACKNGDFNLVKFILLNVEKIDLDDAFKHSCIAGHFRIAKYLLEQDNLKFKSIKMGKITALRDAVRKENFTILNLLMSNIKTQVTPISLDALHLAMESSKKACVKYLLVDLNIDISHFWHQAFLNSTSYKKEMRDYYGELKNKLLFNQTLDNLLYNKAHFKTIKI